MADVVYDSRVLTRILKNLGQNTDDAVRSLGFLVQRYAQQNAEPFVDTGAHWSSIYTETGDAQDYAKAATEARQANPDVDIMRLPIPPEHTVYIGPSVDYGIYLELGTVRRPATPYLAPALQSVVKDVAKKFGEVVTDE